MNYNTNIARNIYWEHTSMCIATYLQKVNKSNATKQIEGTYFNFKKKNGISFTCFANYFERELERSPVFNTFKY
jgi:hypothetical protein